MPDYAVIVENRATKHKGIAVAFSSVKQIKVLGAGGTRLRVGSEEDSYLLEDFDWMDARQVIQKQPLSRKELNEKVPAPMRGEGLLVEKTKSAGAIVFWDRTQFHCYQTSDKALHMQPDPDLG